MPSALSPEDLAGFRKILTDLRARLRGEIEQMTDEALKGAGSDATGNLSSMPLHMADLGSENYDQEFTLGLIENEQATLELIYEALKRVDKGTFGRCEECDGAIPKNRLQALPYTRHCIDCARKFERR